MAVKCRPRYWATNVAMLTIFVPLSLGFALMLTPKYKVDMTTQYCYSKFYLYTLRDLVIKFHLSNPQKALWLERRIMTYWAWGCVQRCDLWPSQREQKGTETVTCQTGCMPRQPISMKPPEILHTEYYPGVVTYFKFHENRLWGWKSPSPIDDPVYNSLYGASCDHYRLVYRVAQKK